MSVLGDIGQAIVSGLMVGHKPYQPSFTERGGIRAYVHKGTKNREVRDGVVYCTVHGEALREYKDKRAKIQRKCRSCNNEYMRNWSKGTAKGMLTEARKNTKRRASERGGGEKPALDETNPRAALALPIQGPGPQAG